MTVLYLVFTCLHLYDRKPHYMTLSLLKIMEHTDVKMPKAVSEQDGRNCIGALCVYMFCFCLNQY